MAHASKDEREAIYARLADGAAIEAAAGVQFTEELLAELLDVLPRNDHDAPVLHNADFRRAVLPTLDLSEATALSARFSGARFEGTVSFAEACFESNASFAGTRFESSAEFDGVRFEGEAGFGMARFQGAASFNRTRFQDAAKFGDVRFRDAAKFDWARFHGDARFVRASFQLGAEFIEARFQRRAEFAEASFQGHALFAGVSFRGEAGFREVSFQGGAGFDTVNFEADAEFDGAMFQVVAQFGGASFQDGASFRRVSVEGEAGFESATFQQPIDLGPMAVAGTLTLDRVESDQPVQIEVAAWRLACRRTRFRAGGHLRIAWAEISLEDAEIPAPLMIVRHPPDQELSKRVGWLAEPEGQTGGFPAPLASLVSVQRADVAGLVLADIDLRACHFAGAHHLDQLQLTIADAFHRAPGMLPGRRGSRGRKVLAEECRWRQTRSGWRGRRWRHTTSELFSSPLLEGARQPGRTEMAVVYRRLRKGREDAKNEPGAADFYYGEMEMRRHTANTPRAERLLLHLYWLASGYGLRGLRALGLLLAFVVLAAAAIHKYGYMGAGQSWSRTFVYAAGAATRLVTPASEVLNDTGQAIRIAMGLLGPLLLGLAVLAVRNRVKR